MEEIIMKNKNLIVLAVASCLLLSTHVHTAAGLGRQGWKHFVGWAAFNYGTLSAFSYWGYLKAKKEERSTRFSEEQQAAFKERFAKHAPCEELTLCAGSETETYEYGVNLLNHGRESILIVPPTFADKPVAVQKALVARQAYHHAQNHRVKIEGTEALCGSALWCLTWNKWKSTRKSMLGMFANMGAMYGMKHFYMKYQEHKADCAQKTFEELLGQLHDVLTPREVRHVLSLNLADPLQEAELNGDLFGKQPEESRRIASLVYQIKKQNYDWTADDTPKTAQECKDLLLLYMTAAQIKQFAADKNAQALYGQKQPSAVKNRITFLMQEWGKYPATVRTDLLKDVAQQKKVTGPVSVPLFVR